MAPWNGLNRMAGARRYGRSYPCIVHVPLAVRRRSVRDAADAHRVRSDVQPSDDVRQEVANERPVRARLVAAADRQRAVDDQHQIGASERAQTSHCVHTSLLMYTPKSFSIVTSSSFKPFILYANKGFFYQYALLCIYRH